MVEYSLDLDLPDIVFENPIIKVVSDTITDIEAYSNVCHSFIWHFDIEAHVYSWNRTFILLMWGKRYWSDWIVYSVLEKTIWRRLPKPCVLHHAGTRCQLTGSHQHPHRNVEPTRGWLYQDQEPASVLWYRRGCRAGKILSCDGKLRTGGCTVVLLRPE